MTAAPVRVGVLALQGSFREHMAMLQRVRGVEVVEVRSKEELESVQGLVIPGGESTTMALVAERWGLIPELQAFAQQAKPIWGTCAGMIFLAERAEGGRAGGHPLGTCWVRCAPLGRSGGGRVRGCCRCAASSEGWQPHGWSARSPARHGWWCTRILP
jgi:putative intracellular protease/amidase